jgi:hypothetical protein
VALVLGGVSVATGIAATASNLANGDYLAAGLDAGGAVLGLGAEYQVYKASTLIGAAGGAEALADAYSTTMAGTYAGRQVSTQLTFYSEASQWTSYGRQASALGDTWGFGAAASAFGAARLAGSGK